MESERKGIILAGGTGSRLSPLTNVINKQLMPIYDKPMIYYPLTTLMLAGIRKIRIITNPEYDSFFKKLFGDGSNLGLELSYSVQKRPGGIAQAYIICRDFIKNSKSALILGDNLFYGSDLQKKLQIVNSKNDNTIFAYSVSDPERYGVVEFDEYDNVIEIVEKPKKAKSRYAITGLYFYDETASEKVTKLKPSNRGELEITDLNKLYLEESNLKVQLMGRGMAWLDTGTFDSLHEAGGFIKTLETRQGLKVGCPEEVSWRLGWIDDNQLEILSNKYSKSNYGGYLKNLLISK